LQARTPEEQQGVLDAVSVWAGRDRRGRNSNRTLTALELTALANADGAEVGSHSVSHPKLPALSAEAQQWEMSNSKSQLERLLGHDVRSFSYPHGEHTDVTAKLASEAGYSVAVAASGGAVARTTPPMGIPRVHVENWAGAEFDRMLDRWFSESSRALG
jgi:peptidoglycan/xylan/chitin deacetylase (PgdA/CDA1 family)